MKANAFPYAPAPAQKKVKTRMRGNRCIMSGKVAMGKGRAEYLASVCQPDDRGIWTAYKCKWGNRHWHIGHSKVKGENV